MNQRKVYHTLICYFSNNGTSLGAVCLGNECEGKLKKEALYVLTRGTERESGSEQPDGV